MCVQLDANSAARRGCTRQVGAFLDKFGVWGRHDIQQSYTQVDVTPDVSTERSCALARFVNIRKFRKLDAVVAIFPRLWQLSCPIKIATFAQNLQKNKNRALYEFKSTGSRPNRLYFGQHAPMSFVGLRQTTQPTRNPDHNMNKSPREKLLCEDLRVLIYIVVQPSAPSGKKQVKISRAQQKPGQD